MTCVNGMARERPDDRAIDGRTNGFVMGAIGQVIVWSDL